MKIKLKSPPPGEKDGFSHDVANADMFFKLIGWLVLIGTLQYAGAVTGRAMFTFWAFGLTLELCYLAMSFVNNRLHIEIVNYNGNRPILRYWINAIFLAIFGLLAWEGASYTVHTGVDEIVAFNKRNQSNTTLPTPTKP